MTVCQALLLTPQAVANDFRGAAEKISAAPFCCAIVDGVMLSAASDPAHRSESPLISAA